MSGGHTPTDTLALRMKSTVEPLEGNKVKLSVEVPSDEFDQAISAAFKKIAKEVRLPGFRTGKAPRKILEAPLGPLVGREQAFQDALARKRVGEGKSVSVSVDSGGCRTP